MSISNHQKVVEGHKMNYCKGLLSVAGQNLKSLNVLVLCLVIAIAGCTSAAKKREAEQAAAAAAQAEQAKIAAEQEAQRQAAEQKVKEEAKKKALAAEDQFETKEVKSFESPKAETLPVETPPVVEASAASSGLEIPTEPNTYLVTVENKTNQHPFYSTGDNRGFVVNGRQGDYVIVQRGVPTTFKVRSGVMHDFYITTSEKGWGAAAYLPGVEGQFTYDGDVTFSATEETPDVLYYGCRNHNSMGGKIIIVNQNADLAPIRAKEEAERNAMLAKFKDAETASVDPAKIRQKISYVEMLMQFKGKGLEEGLKKTIEAKIASAKMLEEKGDLAGALALATEAKNMFEQKPANSGPSEEEIAEQKEKYKDFLITLEAFIDSHMASFKQAKEEGRKTVDYDRDVVKELIVEANNLAENRQYDKALQRVKRAENMVTRALNEMLNDQTLVYDLNFATPADEYQYEVNRYKSYEELIPVAIEVKKPNEGSIKFMETYREKAEFFRQKADESAKAGRWEEAVVIIKDATVEIRRGLRVLGVSM